MTKFIIALGAFIFASMASADSASVGEYCKKLDKNNCAILKIDYQFKPFARSTQLTNTDIFSKSPVAMAVTYCYGGQVRSKFLLNPGGLGSNHLKDPTPELESIKREIANIEKKKPLHPSHPLKMKLANLIKKHKAFRDSLSGKHLFEKTRRPIGLQVSCETMHAY